VAIWKFKICTGKAPLHYRASQIQFSQLFKINSSPPLVIMDTHIKTSLNTDSPGSLPSESTDLGGSGSKIYIPSEHRKGNDIPNLSVRTDGVSGPLYFDEQSNSALLQHADAQARQTFGKKYCFPSAPVLRLMGKSVPIPAKCGNKSMAAENRENRVFSNLPQASSQNHVSRFHPAICASSGVINRQSKGNVYWR
jgi:hypothetical protein